MSSGGSAGGVTPSAATGAAFEPLRSLEPKRKMGPKAQGSNEPALGHRLHRAARDDEVIQHAHIDQGRRLLERLRENLVGP